MKRWMSWIFPAFVLCALVSLFAWRKSGEAGDKSLMLAHMVFFELSEPSPESTVKLVAGCKKYLAGHEGVVHFSVGTLAEDLQREVNDRAFHVALHLVFRDKAAHDGYQKDERHLAFIETCGTLWKKVRVFDSYLVVPPKGSGGDQAKADPLPRIPLPDPATSFAGMVKGKIVERRGKQLVLLVDEVPRSWEHSKAPDPRSMVGKKVLVAPPAESEGEKNVALFLKMLKVGETVTLDVAHKKGETLTVLELSEDQRARVREAR